MGTINNRKRSGLCIFPGYRWCGPGCSGPGAPINDVDACCKFHDRCLTKYSGCTCDREFLRCIRTKINRNSRKGRIAGTMYTYMRYQTLFTCMFKD